MKYGKNVTGNLTLPITFSFSLFLLISPLSFLFLPLFLLSFFFPFFFSLFPNFFPNVWEGDIFFYPQRKVFVIIYIPVVINSYSAKWNGAGIFWCNYHKDNEYNEYNHSRRNVCYEYIFLLFVQNKYRME